MKDQFIIIERGEKYPYNLSLRMFCIGKITTPRKFDIIWQAVELRPKPNSEISNTITTNIEYYTKVCKDLYSVTYSNDIDDLLAKICIDEL